MNNNIQPEFKVLPEIYFEGEESIMTIVIYNTNLSSEAKLNGEDWFEFTFDPKWSPKTRLELVSKTVFVNSPSKALSPKNFTVSLPQYSPFPRSPQLAAAAIRISVRKSMMFLPSEGFGITVRFITPGAPGVGMVFASELQRNKQLDLIKPSFIPVSFVERRYSVPPDATINVLNGGTVNAGEGANITTGDGSTMTNEGTLIVEGGTITAGYGATVHVLPGSNVVLPSDITNPAVPGLPMGPNFLQIAANKWYEAGETGRIILPATPGALCFDGRHLWVAMSEFDKIGKVETSSGVLMEVALLAEPQQTMPSISSFQPRAMVYDGENFWISGMGVVRPDGLMLTNVRLPSGGPNLLFDGKTVLAGAGGLAFDGRKLWETQLDKLISIDQGNGQREEYSIPFVASALVYDGSHLWLADPSNDTVMKYDLDGKLAGGPYPVGAASFNPKALLFDGAHIWVGGVSGVTKLRASNGSLLGIFPTDPVSALAFDGINIWAASSQMRSLAKL